MTLDSKLGKRLTLPSALMVGLCILPPIIKNHLLVVALGPDGYSGAGWPSDFYFLIICGMLWLVISGMFLCLVYWLFRAQFRIALVLACAFLVVEIVQDVTMAVTVSNLEKCGYPACVSKAVSNQMVVIREVRDGSAAQQPATPSAQGRKDLKGTIFFGGSGLKGAYIDDMVTAFREEGITNVSAAEASIWSTGNMLSDALAVLTQNTRDNIENDFSGVGITGEQFNLVGYSYGGLLAAQTAIDYASLGGQVDNLVLVATPIEVSFLSKLKAHPNIISIKIVDLSAFRDPIRTGMSDWHIIKSVPSVAFQFLEGFFVAESGHFYFSERSVVGKARRRDLGRALFEMGLR